jgi:hypothetical protein
VPLSGEYSISFNKSNCTTSKDSEIDNVQYYFSATASGYGGLGSTSSYVKFKVKSYAVVDIAVSGSKTFTLKANNEDVDGYTGFKANQTGVLLKPNVV